MTQGFITLVAGFALGAVRGTKFTDIEAMAGNGFVLSLTTLGSAPVMIGLSVLFAWLRPGVQLIEYLGLRISSVRTIFAWVFILGLYILVADLLTIALGKSIVPDFMINAYKTALFPPLLWSAVVIAAPAAEEFFFRGFLLRGLSLSWLGNWGAILVTALVWSTIHVQYDIYQIAWIFFAGILLGWARVKTGSVLLCVLLHGLMNLVALVETIVYLA